MAIQRPRPQPLVFEQPEEERQHRKERLAAAFRIFAKLGFDEGVMGHLTARDPIRTDHFWFNPFGASFANNTPSDLLLLSYEGDIAEGHGYVHPGAMILHPKLLQLRPDIVSAGHTHSIYGRIWSTYGRLLEPITNESAVFYNRHGIYDSHTGGEGENLVNALGTNNRALILKNHGIVSVGHSVDEMAYWFISLEKCCQVQILAEAAGKPHVLEPELAESISSRATPNSGWLNFQPMYESIVKEQPDLLG